MGEIVKRRIKCFYVDEGSYWKSLLEKILWRRFEFDLVNSNNEVSGWRKVEESI